MVEASELIEMLIAAGWTKAAISDELAVAHFTIERWGKGRRPANWVAVERELRRLLARKRIPKKRRPKSSLQESLGTISEHLEPGPTLAIPSVVSPPPVPSNLAKPKRAENTVYPVSPEGQRDPILGRWLWRVKSPLVISRYGLIVFLWIAFLVLAAVLAGRVESKITGPEVFLDATPGVPTTLQSPTGDVSVLIAAGVLAEPTRFRYARIEQDTVPKLPDGYVQTGHVFDLSVLDESGEMVESTVSFDEPLKSLCGSRHRT